MTYYGNCEALYHSAHPIHPPVFWFSSDCSTHVILRKSAISYFALLRNVLSTKCCIGLCSYTILRRSGVIKLGNPAKALTILSELGIAIT